MDEARARELLSSERERIERTLAGVESGDEAEPSPDPADDATRLSDREVDAGLAEARLAQGTYGLSVESGKPIPDERLEAIPWAERTVEEDEHHQFHR